MYSIYFRTQVDPPIPLMDTPCDVIKEKIFNPYALSKKIYAEIIVNIRYW